MRSKKGPWIVVLILVIAALFQLMPQIRWVFGWLVMLAIFLIICVQFLPLKYTEPKKVKRKTGTESNNKDL